MSLWNPHPQDCACKACTLFREQMKALGKAMDEINADPKKKAAYERRLKQRLERSIKKKPKPDPPFHCPGCCICRGGWIPKSERRY